MINEFKKILDWIYKEKCYFCKNSKYSTKMCDECYEEMDFLPVKTNRIVEGVNIYCCGTYNKNLQKLIRGLKYHNQKDLAYYQAKFMVEYWQRLNLGNDFDVVPVPIYFKRERKRKYNHMKLVAEEFCKLTTNTTNYELIKRIKDTKPQYRLSKKERANNLNKAFEVTPKYNNKKILIIDDICTTGSTFEEMIKEFKKHNITDITCLATTTPFEE
ncbi:MAG: phosphoribosyltransferase family protein [Candidatus Gastranaerophilales bacterium]